MHGYATYLCIPINYKKLEGMHEILLKDILQNVYYIVSKKPHGGLFNFLELGGFGVFLQCF